jgi:hypothetical protein
LSDPTAEIQDQRVKREIGRFKQITYGTGNTDAA